MVRLKWLIEDYGQENGSDAEVSIEERKSQWLE